MKSITAADRSNLIKLASSLPVGDEMRRSILSGIQKVATDCSQLDYNSLVKMLPDPNWDWKSSPLNPTMPSLFENYMKTVQKIISSKMKVQFGEEQKYKWFFKKSYGQYRSGYRGYIKPWAGWSVAEKVKTPFWLSLYVSSDGKDCDIVPIPPSAQKGRRSPVPGVIYVDETDLTPEKFANWAFDTLVSRGAPFGGNISTRVVKGREVVNKFLKEATSASIDPRNPRGYPAFEFKYELTKTSSIWSGSIYVPYRPENKDFYDSAISALKSLISRYQKSFTTLGISLDMEDMGEFRTNVTVTILN